MSSSEIRTSKLEELRVVHQSLPRQDAEEKIAGSTRYAGDFSLPGMLHARLVRSPLPSARIVRRDASPARSVPGVVAVLFGEDVPNNDIWVDVPGQTTEVAALKASMQVLATERVRFHGEPIALVVAENEDCLAEACQEVDVEFEDLPGVFDPGRALEAGAPRVHDGSNLLAEWNIDQGDIDAAFARADVVVEGDYETQLVDHAYLEPECGVAWLDDTGVINIRVATQVIEHYRDVARILGVPESQVRVIGPYVGGGFGGKEDMTVEPYLGVAVARTRRPVRMAWTRAESLTARAKRHRMHMRYRSAASADGTLLAHDVDITTDAGAYAYLSALVLLYAAVHASGPYRTEALRLRSRTVYTNNTPASAMRGFGGMQVVFGYESQMDRLAQALGMKPEEIRKRNTLSRGDELPVGQRIDTEVLLAETIDAVIERAGPRPAPSGPGTAAGRGMASNLQSYGRLVWLNDGRLRVAGVRTRRQPDGAMRSPGRGGRTGGVSGTDRLGDPGDGSGARHGAFRRLRADPPGRNHHGHPPVADVWKRGPRCGRGGPRGDHPSGGRRDGPGPGIASISAEGVVGIDATVPIKEALAICRRRDVPIEALATFHGPKGGEVGRELRSDRIFPDFTFGTHLADVEVDLDTGQVRILRYVASHDVGRAINPQSVEGQIAGGAVQGLGFALLEEVVLQDGVNTTGGFFQYLIPTATDVPDIETVILESGEGMGPFGARGIGEPPIGPPAAAIASAIEDAVGARPTVLPFTPERVLACIREGARSTTP